MKILNRVFILLMLVSIKATGQELLIYFEEGFEDPEKRALWASTPVDPVIFWKYQTGGDNNLPLYAWADSTNAFFSWFDAGGPTYRVLESPPIDLSDASLPLLYFMHAQHKMITFQDELQVLFKAGASAPWDTIDEPFDYHIPDWVPHSFNIAGYGEQYLCEDFQIGFLATGNGGNGVCIDSVVIEEKDIIPKFIRTTEVDHISHSLVPSDIEELPVLRIYLEVFGNVDTLVLNSINFKSLGTSDSDFKTSGFKLYRTRNEIFKNKVNGESTQVGGPVGISGGNIVFNSLNDTLRTGDNYLWLTVDINPGAVHNDSLDFALAANGVSINDTVFPAADINPAGRNVIKQSVFFDNFEASTDWTLQGDFDTNVPQGFIVNIAKDPDFAYSGDKILGTDLVDDGGYIPGITAGSEYYAIGPSMNLKYFKEIQLYAQKWLSFNSNDEVTIDVSTDGGSNWTTIWDRKKDLISFNETSWTEFLISSKIDNIARLNEDVRIRLAMNETSPSYVLGGWNLDNFAIVGNHLEVDVGIVDISAPYNGCLGGGNDSVKVIVRNYAEGPSPANIPIYYTIDGLEGTRYYDTIPGPIPQDDSVVFTFGSPVNFPGPGDYDFVVSVNLNGDEDVLNDTITRQLFLQNSITLPYFEDFEIGSGYWLPAPNTSWSCFEPEGGIPVLTESPNSWFVAPTGVYPNSDTSFIVSNCYDMTSSDKQIIELKYWNESQDGFDGANIEYSIDDGQTWTLIDSSDFGLYSGWYTENVAALGTIGWSGNSGGWNTVRELIPDALLSETNVRFRVMWKTDATTSFGRGFIFDDFNIFTAPQDVGVSNIVNPIDACQLVNNGSVTIEVSNFGPNEVPANDSLFIGIDVDDTNILIDTFVLESALLPTSSISIDIEANIDLVTPKSYKITAYTLNETDGAFYSVTSNDSSTKTIDIWPNPTIVVADTIGSRQPDTVNIVPTYPDWEAGYSYLWTPGNITDSIYDVSAHGFGDTIYKITATEPVHSCSTTDSVNVLLLYFDAGADSIISPISSCELLNNEIIEVQVRNMGTDSLLAGDKIEVFYQVDGGTIYTDTITLGSVLRAGRTVSHQFINDPYDFSTIKSYNIDAWAFYMGGDDNPANDDVSETVFNYGYTPLDLGNNVVVSGLDYTLDAGGGFVSYIWNTGDSSRTSYITAPGMLNYWVDALDVNGCPASDTIQVWFKVRDIQADSLFSPKTACLLDLPAVGYIDFRVINTGSDTITTLDKIVYSYNIDGSGAVIDTASPTVNINPGAQYTHRFATSEDFTTIKSYSIVLTASAIGDLNTNNDTISTTFKTNSNPVVDLGDYPEPIYTAQFILDAGAGGYSYLWQDGLTTSRTFTATDSDTYSVTVTDNLTGCQGYDETILVFDILDYAIASISGLAGSICQYENLTLKAKVTNEGNEDREDVSITVAYKINNNPIVSEAFTISGTWLKKGLEEKEVTFSSPVSFDVDGSSTIDVFVSHEGDIKPENDTISQGVSVDESPAVNFGGDTIQVSIPHQLDAGEHAFYQWQDNYDGRYYDVTSPTGGLYTVTVTDIGNSCITTKSVFVEPLLSTWRTAQSIAYKLYPNPAKDFLNIEAKLDLGNELTIEIYNINNRLIWTDYYNGYGTYNHKLDISAFDAGVYIIRFKNGDMNYSEHFIVH